MANESVSLFSGKIDIVQNDKQLPGFDVSIYLQWLPTPSLRFDMSGIPYGVHLAIGLCILRIIDFDNDIRATIAGQRTSINTKTGYQSSASGWLNEVVVRPETAMVKYSLFLLPNFDCPSGAGLTYPDGSTRWARLILLAQGWKITLDQVDNHTDLIETLKSSSGYGVTHIGRIEREDETEYCANDITRILAGLGRYFSFCSGSWTGPLLARGFNSNDGQVWERWDTNRISPYQYHSSWMDPHCENHCRNPLPGFLKLWLDDEWHEIIDQAIHWYVEANAQAGSIEGSIMLTQTAFELLASAILVEQFSWLSNDGYDKVSAADRLRLLLRWAGIPTTIPSELEALVRCANEFNWPDAPDALIQVRNTITHPKKKNRDKSNKYSSEVRHDIWQMGLWYLELCLLRLFDYQGTYGKRLSFRYAGQVEQVPWTIAEK